MDAPFRAAQATEAASFRSILPGEAAVRRIDLIVKNALYPMVFTTLAEKHRQSRPLCLCARWRSEP